MTKREFMLLHRDLRVNVKHSPERNSEPSATDPTQDIPIKNIELAANGVPVNVRIHNMPMNGVKVEDFTTADKRNNDIFDMNAELQELAKTPSKNGVTTDYKPIKTKKTHEN